MAADASNSASAGATGGSGYKAMVCLFLYGGNDGNNLLIASGEGTAIAVRLPWAK